jgi:cysteinyl-tRNA synthetase
MKIYNTLTKTVEEFFPAHQDHVNMYSCGPTVYNYAHIGNLRSFVMADVLFRTLKLGGFKPHWVMNITDIDDKTIRGALAEYGEKVNPQNLYAWTEKYLQAFLADLKAVGVNTKAMEIIRVTDKMPEIQTFILELMAKGYAYKAEDGVYFSIEKYQTDFGDYGQLAGEKFMQGKKIGARVAVDEYEKENLSDFVLWKHHNPETDGQIFWEHPTLGKGRPGWHIECSVINQVAFKGETTDIHTGGVDLIFPHHTNEIAQSQPIYKPYVNYWHHNEHLLVDGARMGKRFKNFYTLKDLSEKGFSGEDLRYFFMNSGFGVQQNFTWDALMAAKTSRIKLINLPQTDLVNEPFKQALLENLSCPQALSAIWQAGKINSQIVSVLGFTAETVEPIPLEVLELLQQRQNAKAQKDFSTADALRTQIAELGYEVLDTNEGQKVRKNH